MADQAALPTARALPASSVVNISTLLPVLGLLAGYTTYLYLRRTTSPLLPIPIMGDSTTSLLASRTSVNASTTLVLRHGNFPRRRAYAERLQSLCLSLWEWLRSWTERERPYTPIIDEESPDWEQSEPNAEGWRHSPFHWEPSPRFPRGSEDSEFERRWAPRDELAPHVRARIEREEREERERRGDTAETAGSTVSRANDTATADARCANAPNGYAQATGNQRQGGRSTSTICQNGSNDSTDSLTDLEPVHPIDWSLNGFGL